VELSREEGGAGLGVNGSNTAPKDRGRRQGAASIAISGMKRALKRSSASFRLGAVCSGWDHRCPGRGRHGAVIIGYVMPFFDLELLDMARDVAAFNLPARMGQLFGVSL
jgi:hypothetical protein